MSNIFNPELIYINSESYFLCTEIYINPPKLKIAADSNLQAPEVNPSGDSMRHLDELERIRQKLNHYKKEVATGAMSRREYKLIKAELKYKRLKLKNMLDGTWSPSEQKRHSAAVSPVSTITAATAAPIDDFAISPIIRGVLNRFNHLTVDEAIMFARQVRDAGGSILTHSGVFAPTRRRWSSKSRRYAGQFDVYYSWTCCDSVIEDDVKPGHITFVHCHESDDPRLGIYIANAVSSHTCPDDGPCEYPDQHKSAPDLKNRNPIGSCMTETLFHLVRNK